MSLAFLAIIFLAMEAQIVASGGKLGVLAYSMPKTLFYARFSTSLR